MILKGRLGLETARIPHADRHGLLWLSRGNLYVEDGTLQFVAAKSPEMKAGRYGIPFQNVSMLIMGPGTTITHDCLRLLARNGTGLICVAEGGVRMYTAPPLETGDSAYARKQAYLWADEKKRLEVARFIYKLRLGEENIPETNINALRGIEGARIRESYKIIAQQWGISWHGRHYDRQNPGVNDTPNQALNHAATAMEGAAMIAVASTGTIPQLGFIHEDPAISFCLDIADIYRTTITVPIAFKAAKFYETHAGNVSLDQVTRRFIIQSFKKHRVVSRMIEDIKRIIMVQ